MRRGQSDIGYFGEPADSRGQKILQPDADHAEGEKEDKSHDGDEKRNGGVFAGEKTVNPLAAQMLAAFAGLHHARGADLVDERKTHIRHRRTAVETALALHLQRDVFQHLGFICVQFQLLKNTAVTLNELAGGKTDRNAGASRVIFDQVAHGVNTPVNSTAVVFRTAEVLPERLFLIPGDVDRVADQLVHALVFGGGDRNHGDSQHRLHLVDLERTAVAGDLIHHVQGDDHRRFHLQQLHGEVEIALDVGGIDDVDNGFGLLVQDKIPGDQFFTGIGRHGIDSRKIGNPGVGLAADYAVLAVYRDAGEVPDVLVGAGQLVEQGRFAAVLVPDQSKGEQRAVRKRITGSFWMKTPFLSETGVFRFSGTDFPVLGCGERVEKLNVNPRCIGQPQGQLISVNAQLHRISHGRQFHHGQHRAGDHTHIQKMLTQRALPADPGDTGALAGLQFRNGHAEDHRPSVNR